MCTPSPRPGAGFIDPELWKNEDANKEILRREFDGPKGRSWVMKWLPARAYDNAVFAVFSNATGMDDDQLKNAGGYRYIKAGRPDLYREIIGKPHESNQKVVWMNE